MPTYKCSANRCNYEGESSGMCPHCRSGLMVMVPEPIDKKVKKAIEEINAPLSKVEYMLREDEIPGADDPEAEKQFEKRIIERPSKLSKIWNRLIGK